MQSGSAKHQVRPSTIHFPTALHVLSILDNNSIDHPKKKLTLHPMFLAGQHWLPQHKRHS